MESTLPKAWEVEETFHDALYDWMQRAPWLAISAAAHLVVFLIVQAIPWNLFQEPEPTTFQSDVITAVEEIIEEPPPEEVEEVKEEKLEEEPEIQDDVTEVEDPDTVDDVWEDAGDPEYESDAPFENFGLNDVIGIDGGGGGPGGNRGLGGPRGTRTGRGTEPALEAGLLWLAKHQSEDGSWDCDEFMHNHARGGCECDQGGDALHDVGVTGLALLAFLGDGNTTRDGMYRDNVLAGIKWLRLQQDPETGLLGDEIGKEFLYDHALGTLALCEAYYASRSPLLARPAQLAINYITRARNPYGAWRYDMPPVGDQDTSVTGWMVFALKSAQDAGLKVDREAFTSSLLFLDDMTDPANGRVGYDTAGSPSSRTTGINDHFPTERGEAMTAVGLLCRIFLGQEPDTVPIMRKHADLMLHSLPEWDPDGFGTDMYYWYYGTYAMYQMGGRYWKAWRKAMEPAVVRSQRTDGDFNGSWDPVGPWGHSGGRVYSTALMVLCLEVYFRYSRVLGAR
ncbi:MAG: terpene cyclase/mutase family protein [bacterium]|nr:terpene cyclase/mutase family protein [bacterium]